LHLGGARTCLFNWLYARHVGAKFLLRIEDTDLARSKKEYLRDEIFRIVLFKWLGMDWDELGVQSKRFDIYKEHAQRLVKKLKDGVFFNMILPISGLMTVFAERSFLMNCLKKKK
jgi:glutamyl/glutaminyl-tRNA synthetase